MGLRNPKSYAFKLSNANEQTTAIHSMPSTELAEDTEQMISVFVSPRLTDKQIEIIISGGSIKQENAHRQDSGALQGQGRLSSTGIHRCLLRRCWGPIQVSLYTSWNYLQSTDRLRYLCCCNHDNVHILMPIMWNTWKHFKILHGKFEQKEIYFGAKKKKSKSTCGFPLTWTFYEFCQNPSCFGID